MGSTCWVCEWIIWRRRAIRSPSNSFLIGVNELGQGYREFTKDEKINLLHIAICKLLSRYGYYEFVGKDEDGWPHWKTNSELPILKSGEQTILMKEAAIIYFSESGIDFQSSKQ